MSRVRLPIEQQWRARPGPFLDGPPIHRGVEPLPLALELSPIIEHLETFGRLSAVRGLELAQAEQRPLEGLRLRLRCPNSCRQSWVNAIQRGFQDVTQRAGRPWCFEWGSEGSLLAEVSVQAKPRRKSLGLPRPGQQLWLTRPLGSDVLVEAYHQQARTAAQTRHWLEQADRPGPAGPRGERVLGVQIGVTGLAGAAARLAQTTELDVILDATALPAWPGALEHLFAGVEPASCALNARVLGRRFVATRGVSGRARQLALAADWTGGILWASDRPERGVCIGELRKPRQKPAVRLLRALPT